MSFQGTVSIPTVDFPQVSLPAYSEGLINDGKYRPERYNLAVMVYVGGDAE